MKIREESVGSSLENEPILRLFCAVFDSVVTETEPKFPAIEMVANCRYSQAS